MKAKSIYQKRQTARRSHSQSTGLTVALANDDAWTST